MKLQNRIVIAASYFFCSLNCFIVWAASFLPVANHDGSIVILGILMAVMVPISYVDPRPQAQSNIAALSSIFLHFLFNSLVAILFRLWWLVPVFVPETILLIVLYTFVKRKME